MGVRQIVGCLRRFLAATEALRDAEREQRRQERIAAAQKKKGKKKGGGKKKKANIGPLVRCLPSASTIASMHSRTKSSPKCPPPVLCKGSVRSAYERVSARIGEEGVCKRTVFLSSLYPDCLSIKSSLTKGDRSAEFHDPVPSHGS